MKLKTKEVERSIGEALYIQMYQLVLSKDISRTDLCSYEGEWLERYKEKGYTILNVLDSFSLSVMDYVLGRPDLEKKSVNSWVDNTSQFANFIKEYKEFLDKETDNEIKFSARLSYLKMLLYRYDYLSNDGREQSELAKEYLLMRNEAKQTVVEIINSLETIDKKFFLLQRCFKSKSSLLKDDNISTIIAKFLINHRISEVKNFNISFKEDAQDSFNEHVGYIDFIRTILRDFHITKKMFKDDLHLYDEYKKLSNLGKTEKIEDLPMDLFENKLDCIFLNLSLFPVTCNVTSANKDRWSEKKIILLKDIYHLFKDNLSVYIEDISEYLKYLSLWTISISTYRYGESQYTIDEFIGKVPVLQEQIGIKDDNEFLKIAKESIFDRLNDDFSYYKNEDYYFASLFNSMKNIKNVNLIYDNLIKNDNIVRRVMKKDYMAVKLWGLSIKSIYDRLNVDEKLYIINILNGIFKHINFKKLEIRYSINIDNEVSFKDLKNEELLSNGCSKDCPESPVIIALIDLLYKDEAIDNDLIYEILSESYYAYLYIHNVVNNNLDVDKYLLKIYVQTFESYLDFIKNSQIIPQGSSGNVYIYNIFDLNYRYPSLMDNLLINFIQKLENIAYVFGNYGEFIISIYNCKQLRSKLQMKEQDYIDILMRVKEEEINENLPKIKPLLMSKNYTQNIFSQIIENNNIAEGMKIKEIKSLIHKMKEKTKASNPCKIYSAIQNAEISMDNKEELQKLFQKTYLNLIKNEVDDIKMKINEKSISDYEAKKIYEGSTFVMSLVDLYMRFSLDKKEFINIFDKAF